ncbi:hypothetical protein M3Y94_00516000 [Aphelenchoides besseyi]|nr:hypothetical protein M3Y94_00516000 [Aphelenchoides besseyi]KAI6226006.1 hypothetical protein M3Y95_00756700 [Aphelenchoides besseyi]
MADQIERLRKTGVALVEKGKSNPTNVLIDEEIVAERKELLKLVDEICSSGQPAASKTAIDLAFRFCWYEAISTFRKQKVRNRDSLDNFILDGIRFFKQIGTKHKDIQARALQWAGDLSRYHVKLCSGKHEETIRIYEEAISLEPENTTAMTKLAVAYEAQNPERAFYLQLRSLIAKETISTETLAAIKLADTYKYVYAMALATFESDKEIFDTVVEEFKSLLTDELSNPNGHLLELLHFASIIVFAANNKTPTKLKSLISTITDFLNRHLTEVTGHLNENDMIASRRMMSSPFEEATTVAEALKAIGETNDSSFYADVLLPVIPTILSVNEWVEFLGKFESNSTVAWRMMFQGVCQSFANLLNTLSHILVYRVRRKTEWPNAFLWTVRGPFEVQEEWAFKTLIDNLVRSVNSLQHPLTIEDNRFKCDSGVIAKKKSQLNEPKKRVEFNIPKVLFVTQQSMQLHWSKIVFVVNSKTDLVVVLFESTFVAIEQRALNYWDGRDCLKHLEQLRHNQRCILIADDMGTDLSLVAARFPADQVVLIAEESESRQASKRIRVLNGFELYEQFRSSLQVPDFSPQFVF